MALPRLSCFTIWCVVVSLSLTSVIGSNEAKQVTTTKEPSSLKEMMDFFGKLANDSSKEKVLEKLEKRVKEYFDTNNINNNKSIKEYLKEVLTNIGSLRQEILNNPQSYGEIPCLITSNDNADECVNQVIHWLPSLHSMMWFIYFNTATECVRIGRQDWGYKKIGKGQTTKLHRWLTDQPSQEDNNVLKRGYQDEELKAGLFEATKISKLSVGDKTGGALDHAQFGLFMLDNKWNKSNLASVTLFLKAYCKDIVEDKLKGHNEETYNQLKQKCPTLISAIDELHASLWPLYNPSIYGDKKHVQETNQVKKESQTNNQIYEGKLKAEKLSEYETWITTNIPDVIKSVKEMHQDSSSWSKEDFDDYSSMGPFKYGFVFKDNKWDGSIYYQLQATVTNLKSSLIEFLCCYSTEQCEELKKELERQRETTNEERKIPAKGKTEETGTKTPSSSKHISSPKAPSGGDETRSQDPSPAHPGATHNEKSQVTNNASTSEGSKEANPKTTESSEQSQQGTDFQPGSHAEQAKESVGPGPANTIDGSSEGGEQSQHEHVSGQITDPETPSATGKGGAEKTSEATNLHDPSKHLDDSLSLKASMGELPRTIVAMVASLILF